MDNRLQPETFYPERDEQDEADQARLRQEDATDRDGGLFLHIVKVRRDLDNDDHMEVRS